MGQRANLILVHSRQHELYYTHWRANTLDRDLFWGPEHATLFARVQQPTAEWLDEVWAEGGAVIDHDARVLLLYGGEDTLHGVPLRRLYLRALARAWDGWEIRWAHEGIADLADYVGHPRADVLTADTHPPIADVHVHARPSFMRLVVSLVDDRGRLRLYTPLEPIKEILRAGPRLLPPFARAEHHDRLDFSGPETHFPGGGIHIDAVGQTLDFWLASSAEEIAVRTAAAWPGWAVTWHRDRYESQLERCRGQLSFAAPDEDKLRACLRESLLAEEHRTGVDLLLDTMNALAKHGEEVTHVNPNATRDAHLTLSPEARREIVDRALRP
jgi:hypothetical protein